jgi:hypothetical protein
MFIPDPDFSISDPVSRVKKILDPGYRIKKIPDPVSGSASKDLSILNPKNCF